MAGVRAWYCSFLSVLVCSKTTFSQRLVLPSNAGTRIDPPYYWLTVSKNPDRHPRQHARRRRSPANRFRHDRANLGHARAVFLSNDFHCGFNFYLLCRIKYIASARYFRLDNGFSSGYKLERDKFSPAGFAESRNSENDSNSAGDELNLLRFGSGFRCRWKQRLR